MPDANEILENLGLEEPEVKTYLALLDLGEATATKLAERAGLGRVHIYQITTKLIEKGLASYVIKNNVKYFRAANPETLLKELQQKEDNLKKIIPELKARQQLTKSETKVEIYRGTEGINTIFKIILKEKEDYYMLGGGNECCTNQDVQTILNIFLKRAEQLEMKGWLLERKESQFYVAVHEEYRFLPKEYFSSTTLTIWGNKMATFVWTRPYYVIVVENEEVAKSNLNTFKYLWKTGVIPTKEDKQKRLIRI